jgi:hypothetical protein
MQVKHSYRFAPGRPLPNPLSPVTWFARPHPLAELAQERCAGSGHPLLRLGACGACWEQVVRDDERFVVECGLPRELTVDPSDVDEVAVNRACTGEAVRLTRYEVWAAVDGLRDRGLSTGQIAARLGRDDTVVRRILAGLAARGVAA